MTWSATAPFLHVLNWLCMLGSFPKTKSRKQKEGRFSLLLVMEMLPLKSVMVVLKHYLMARKFRFIA